MKDQKYYRNLGNGVRNYTVTEIIKAQRVKAENSAAQLLGRGGMVWCLGLLQTDCVKLHERGSCTQSPHLLCRPSSIWLLTHRLLSLWQQIQELLKNWKLLEWTSIEEDNWGFGDEGAWACHSKWREGMRLKM